MNLIWHQPAVLYVLLLIKDITLHAFPTEEQNSRLLLHLFILMGESELLVARQVSVMHNQSGFTGLQIWNQNEDKLYVSAIHSTVNNSRAGQARARL